MLTFNLKKEWFEKIKKGEKTHEYRECKLYWYKRLFHAFTNCSVDIELNKDNIFCSRVVYPNDETICFKCGYPKSNETDKIMYAKIISIRKIYGTNTDLKINKPVFDIEFELIKQESE